MTGLTRKWPFSSLFINKHGFVNKIRECTIIAEKNWDPFVNCQKWPFWLTCLAAIWLNLRQNCQKHGFCQEKCSTVLNGRLFVHSLIEMAVFSVFLWPNVYPHPRPSDAFSRCWAQKCQKRPIWLFLVKKTSKTAISPKPGWNAPLKLSLLAMNPNMAIRCLTRHFVFNRKEAWWTAQGHETTAPTYMWPGGWWAMGYGGAVVWGGMGVGMGMASTVVWVWPVPGYGYGQYRYRHGQGPVQALPLPVQGQAITDQYGQYRPILPNTAK